MTRRGHLCGHSLRKLWWLEPALVIPALTLTKLLIITGMPMTRLGHLYGHSPGKLWWLDPRVCSAVGKRSMDPNLKVNSAWWNYHDYWG